MNNVHICVQVVCEVHSRKSDRGNQEHYSSKCSTRQTCETTCAGYSIGGSAARAYSTSGPSTCDCDPPTYVQRTSLLYAFNRSESAAAATISKK